MLNGLGIPFVGERTAQILARTFGSMDAIAERGQETLQEAEEVGPKVAHSIQQFFDEPRNRELVERLRKAGLQFTQEIQRKAPGPLEGKNIRADRHLPTLRARTPRSGSKRRAAK